MFSYYDRWTKYEDDKLNRLYNEVGLDIKDVKIDGKKTYSIITRLVELKYIDNFSSVRGYGSYSKTKEYIDYMSSGVYTPFVEWPHSMAPEKI